jgi:cytochrome c biogenesis protein CcmG, thiol:disulfide interchange protein DsbE
MLRTLIHERVTRRTLLILVVLLLLMGGLTWYLRYSAVRDEVGKAASELLADSDATPYTTLSGEPFSFTAYRGKIRVVNVWASWSPFAATELPILNEIAQTYTEQGVVAIAVNRKEQKERAAAYVATQPALPNVIMAIDETDAFYQSVGGYAMPETIIFNEAGDIVWHYRGVVTKALVAEQIDQLLQ